MEYTIIEVPDMNDSKSRIALNGTMYQIRFTYNDTADYWKFGLYDSQDNPVAVGIKIVPGTVLNLFFGRTQLPQGAFGVRTELDRVGRDDFTNGRAEFIFVPADDIDEG
jgi:hypothetical protein